MRIFYSFLLLVPFLAACQGDSPKSFEQYMQEEVKKNGFSGVTLVMQKGKVVYQKAFGVADREWNIPNTNQTKFRVGSITKQFTAAAIMLLNEQGKLSLDDRLSKFIPDYPKGDSVTVHMLLDHQSGISNYTNIEAFWPKAPTYIPVDSLIAVFKNAPYDFSPGNGWNYSNSGYVLLGYIIEKVSGQSYTQFLTENVINKAGLKNTGVDKDDSILLNRARGYYRTKEKQWKPAMYISMTAPYSAGAMFSTTNDLILWMKALMSDKVVSTSSREKMTTPYAKSYGYGLVIDSLKDHRRINHSGGLPGFTSYLAHFPKDDAYVVVISNASNDSGDVGEALSAILFKLPIEKKKD